MKILMFSTHSMKYIWYSPQKSKYPLYTTSLILSISLLLDLEIISETTMQYLFISLQYLIRPVTLLCPLALCMLGKSSCFLCQLLTFFSKLTLKKKSSSILSVWIYMGENFYDISEFRILRQTFHNFFFKKIFEYTISLDIHG